MEVRHRTTLPEQARGRHDLFGGHAGDARDALGRVVATERRVALERRAAIDRAAARGAAHRAERQRIFDAFGILSRARVVDHGTAASLIPRRVVRGRAADVEIGGGKKPPGVVAHQEGAVGPVADELPVVPALGDHDPGDAERQRAVRSRSHAQPLVGAARRPGATWVDDHQRGPARLHLDNRRRLGQVRVRRIVTPEQQAAGTLEVRRADVSAEGICGREVAVPGAHLLAPDEVGAAEHPHEAVDPRKAVGHRGASRCRQRERHRLRSVALGHLAHARGGPVERLVPANPCPTGVGLALRPRAAHRMEQAIGRVDELGRRAALHAEARARRMRGIGLDGHQPAVLHDRDAAAARAAQRAEARNALDAHAPSLDDQRRLGQAMACVS